MRAGRGCAHWRRHEGLVPAPWSPRQLSVEGCYALPCVLGPAPVCLAQKPEGSGTQPGCISLIHSEGPVRLAVALGRPAGLRGAITSRTCQISVPFWACHLSHLLLFFFCCLCMCVSVSCSLSPHHASLTVSLSLLTVSLASFSECTQTDLLQENVSMAFKINLHSFISSFFHSVDMWP